MNKALQLNIDTKDISKKTTSWGRRLFRWTCLATCDIFRVLVVIPASLVATLILVFILLSGDSVSSTLTLMYELRDEVGNVAGDGLIHVKTCKDERTIIGDSVPQHIPPCENWRVEEVPIADIVSDWMSTVRQIYVLLVVIGFFALWLLGAWGRYTKDTP